MFIICIIQCLFFLSEKHVFLSFYLNFSFGYYKNIMSFFNIPYSTIYLSHILPDALRSLVFLHIHFLCSSSSFFSRFRFSFLTFVIDASLPLPIVIVPWLFLVWREKVKSKPSNDKAKKKLKEEKSKSEKGKNPPNQRSWRIISIYVIWVMPQNTNR